VLSFLGTEFSLPHISEALRVAVRDARRFVPDLSFAKLSRLLEGLLARPDLSDHLVERIVLAGTDSHIIVRALPKFEASLAMVLDHLFPQVSSVTLRTSTLAASGLVQALRMVRPNENPSAHPRSRPPVFEVADPALSLQLLDLFDAHVVAFQANERADRFAELQRNRQLVTCECCWVDSLPEEICECERHHPFCKKCLVRQIETVLAEGRTDLRCLHMGGCSAQIPVCQLLEKVPEKTLRRLFAAECESAVREAQVSDLVKCHHCGFVAQYVVWQIGAPRPCPFHCGECGSNTCPTCGQMEHPGMTCEVFAALDKERIVEERQNEALLRVCPNCQARFIKDQGCNRMDCPRCKSIICYWCGQVIAPEIGYAHFWRAQSACPPDRCPLWVADETVNLIQVEGAAQRAREQLALI
jgi:TRIAD3 protein (E3 ubiquitin-protein ligase RNF216)